MLINFNIKKLDSLLLDFHKLTGLTISVWDSNLNQLSYQPREMPSFCRYVKRTKIGNKRCFESDKELCLQCLSTKQPQTHRCHAGLIDTAIPITFKEQVLGFLMFGQVTSTQSKEQIDTQISTLCKELKLDKNDLLKAHSELAKYEPDTIRSAANILKLATRYLWLSDMLKIDNDDLTEEIDAYIRANLASKITVETLCKRFSISKNKLYALIRTRLRTTIGNYVKSVRIDVAKHLLTTTDLPVYEICYAVGIAEYNYFSSIFKKATGVTPLQYRKLFPFILKE